VIPEPHGAVASRAAAFMPWARARSGHSGLPACALTSSAKFSVFFSMPSPTSKRAKPPPGAGLLQQLLDLTDPDP
jgi:hypothetical protein